MTQDLNKKIKKEFAKLEKQIKTGEFTRRGIILSFALLFTNLTGCGTLRELQMPYVINLGGLRNDFWGLHLRNQKVGVYGKFDPPGVNLSQGYGSLIVSATKGKIFDAFLNKDGGNIIHMDCGVFDTRYAHLEKILVEKNEQKNRGDPIGTEGDTGKNIEMKRAFVYIESVVHFTLMGNAAIKNDINYETGYVSEEGARYGKLVHKGRHGFISRFLCNPDKWTPNGKPLIESPWNGKTDYDTKYYEKVIIVQENIKRFLRDFKGTNIAFLVDPANEDGVYFRKKTLAQRVNTLWEGTNGYIRENNLTIPNIPTWELKEEHGKDPLTRSVFRIYECVNEAAKYFVITLPYII